MPLRMSVRPTPTKPEPRTGSSARQHVENAPQRLRINSRTDTDAISTWHLNLDRVHHTLRRCSFPRRFRCDRHRDQCRTGQETVSVKLAPAEELVRVEIVATCHQ